MALTPFFGLSTLPASATNADKDKFCVQDRLLIDRILWEASTGHRHDGSTVGSESAPGTDAVNVTLQPTEGFLPSNTEIFYRWTTVSTAGLESLPSDVVSLTTPAGLSFPDPPSVSKLTTGGSCAPGAYVYRITAWRGAYTYDSLGSAPVVANLLLTDGSFQQVVLTLPALPSGADGFNIYRQLPNSTVMQYMATIEAADVGDPWYDTGAASPLPTVTYRNQDLSVTGASILLEADTTVPSGEKIRLYRSYVNDTNWVDTFIGELTHSDGDFEDLGGPSVTGTPPNTSFVYSNPGPVDIDTETEGYLAAERISGFVALETQTDGTLPLERVQGFLHVADFNQDGAAALGLVGKEWLVPYTKIRPISLTMSLPEGSVPDTDDLIVDLELFNGATWDVVYTAQIDSGQSDMQSDIIGGLTQDEFDLGDRLRFTVTQIGGGGNTDEDLTIQLVMQVRQDTVAFDWAS